MAKLNEKQILLTVGGATLLLCGVAGFGVYWAMDLVEQEKAAIAQKNSQIDAARAKIRKIPKVENAVIILRENVHEYVKILPKALDLHRFFRTAQRFAIQSGVGFEKVIPGRATGKRTAFEPVVYRFEFKATLWQFMKFINFFENYERFVKVREVRLTPSRTRGTTVAAGDTIHSFTIQVETYVYNQKAKGKLTTIPNYPNKRNKLSHEIAASLQNLQLDRYEFKGQEGRRDIFSDPREVATGDNPDGLKDRIPPQKQKELIQSSSTHLGNLKKLWKQSKDSGITIFERYEMQKKVHNGLVELSGIVDEVSKNNLISNQALKVRWYKEVTQPLKSFRDVVHQGDEVADKYLSKEEFQVLIRDVKSDLMSGDLQRAITRYQNVQPKTEAPAGDERYNARVQLEGFILRAKVAQEFQGMTLQIAGVVVNEDGKSGVILNKQVYQEGDWVTDLLFIKGVRREEVEFVYKGFTLVKTW